MSLPLTEGSIKGNDMDITTFTGILRSVLSAAGGIAVSKGWIGADTSTAIIGALITLGSTGWSIVHHVTNNNDAVKTIP